MLGAAVYKAFKAQPGITGSRSPPPFSPRSPLASEHVNQSTLIVKGLSHSRPTSELEAVDLTDPHATEAVFASFKPDWVVHCAAERRPDVADKVRSELDSMNHECI